MISCDKCIHFSVCELRNTKSKAYLNFINFDNPKSSYFIEKDWELTAEFCNHFKE